MHKNSETDPLSLALIPLATWLTDVVMAWRSVADALWRQTPQVTDGCGSTPRPAASTDTDGVVRPCPGYVAVPEAPDLVDEELAWRAA